jgi:drug/metabolite transporter (DMT)-like permease
MQRFLSSLPLRWILLILLSLIWGSSFILIKKGLEHFGYIQAATIRLMTGGLTLLPFALFQFRKISKSNWRYVALSGFLAMFLPAYLFCFAQQYIPSSVAGILNALTPTFTFMIAVLWFKNRYSSNQILGLIIGLGASIYLSMLTSKSGWSINGHVLLVILATICYGININIVKNHLSNVPALAVSTCSVVFAGFLAMTIFFLPNIKSFAITPEAYASLYALMGLGLLGTAIAIILHNYLISISSALFASANTYFIPVVAIGWGLIFGEQLSIYHLFGIAGIFLAIILIRKQP